MGKAKGSFLLSSSASGLGSVQMWALGRLGEGEQMPSPCLVGSGDGLTRQVDKVQVKLLSPHWEGLGTFVVVSHYSIVLGSSRREL